MTPRRGCPTTALGNTALHAMQPAHEDIVVLIDFQAEQDLLCSYGTVQGRAFPNVCMLRSSG